MDKKIMILIISIIILILLVSLIITETHKQKRERLFLELKEADTIEECKSISEQIVNLGHECFRSFDTWQCADLSQFYGDFMIDCISHLAVRQNNPDLCFNEEINEEICGRWEDFDISSLECVDVVEELCLISFILRSNENTTIDIDCNFFKEEFRRNECFEFLANANNDQ